MAEEVPESLMPTSHIFRGRMLWRQGLCAAVGAVCILGALPPADGQTNEPTDPVLELLLQKGVISKEEVEKAQAQLAAIRSNTFVNAMPSMESKWKINNAINYIELFGDLRLRYERREATAPDDSSIDLDRLRYAVRIGLRGEVFDDWYYGVRLDTGVNPRSPWVTLGTS